VTGGGGVQPIEPIDTTLTAESNRTSWLWLKIVSMVLGTPMQLMPAPAIAAPYQRAVTSYDDQRFDLKLTQYFFCIRDHM